MGKFYKDADGWRFIFTRNQKRRGIRVREVTDADVRKDVEHHLNEIVRTRKVCKPPPEPTRIWLESIDDGLHKKLAKASLVNPRNRKDKSRKITVDELVSAIVPAHAIRKNIADTPIVVPECILCMLSIWKSANADTRQQAKRESRSRYARAQRLSQTDEKNKQDFNLMTLWSSNGRDGD